MPKPSKKPSKQSENSSKLLEKNPLKPTSNLKSLQNQDSSGDHSSELSEVPSDLEEYLRSQTSVYQSNSSTLSQYQTASENYCFICSLTLASKSELESHMYFHTPCNVFKCSMCGKSFKFKSSLNKHLREYHSEEKFRRFSRRKTSKWLKSFLKSSPLEEHLFLAEKEKPNMIFFEDLITFSTFHEELQKSWASREFYDDNSYKYEEFFEELK